MFRFRLFIIFTISWLALLLNFEVILNRLEIAIHIQPFVYILAITTVVSMMLVLRLRDYASSFIVTMLVLLYSIGKLLFPTRIDITVIAMELGLILGTYVITRPVADWFGSYSNNIKQAVFNPNNTLLQDNHDNIAAIERKISLARRFERQLSVLYIPMGEQLRGSSGIKTMALQRQVKELVHLIVGKNCLYAWNESNLILCLQGEAIERVETIVQEFSIVIADVLKTEVQLGLANFPKQGLILDDLIATAIESLGQTEQVQEATTTIQFNPKPAQAVQTVSA